jgi:phosphoenolpyruvate phosphomutase
MHDASGIASSTNVGASSPLVYVALVADILHNGHINVLNRARQLGKVVVGVLTDEAVKSYKRQPLLSFEQRRLILENVKGIELVVPQYTMSYKDNILAFKPRYVVHGDDWRDGVQSAVRTEVEDLLRIWGGEIVEVGYTPGISSTMLHEALRERGILARSRQMQLRSLLTARHFVRVIEAHSAISAMIGERTRGNGRQFDAFWSGSVVGSIKGAKPDTEVVDHRARLRSMMEVFEVTTKPLIYEGDSGLSPEFSYYLARSLDSCGVSAICIGDKMRPENNSLCGVCSKQHQAPVSDVVRRIAATHAAIPSNAMMVITRIENLVLGRPMEEAVDRAMAYQEAGADAIVIQGFHPTGEEAVDFSGLYRQRKGTVPVFVISTSYPSVPEQELIDRGVNGVIYTDGLLRASCLAMVNAAADILLHGRARERDPCSAKASDALDLFPELFSCPA